VGRADRQAVDGILTVAARIFIFLGGGGDMITAAGRCRYGSLVMRIQVLGDGGYLTVLRTGPVGLSVWRAREMYQP